MDLRRNAKQELARGRLLGRNTVLPAISKVLLDGLLELGPQFGNSLAVKADDAADPQDAANKDVVSLVIFDPSV